MTDAIFFILAAVSVTAIIIFLILALVNSRRDRKYMDMQMQLIRSELQAESERVLKARGPSGALPA